MTFTRHSPTLATARSVATRIEEVRSRVSLAAAFLLKYEQQPGVFVELDSLTLSRRFAIVRPVAMPLVNQAACESMTRTRSAAAFLRRSRVEC
jgi:hypothetical protein